MHFPSAIKIENGVEVARMSVKEVFVVNDGIVITMSAYFLL